MHENYAEETRREELNKRYLEFSCPKLEFSIYPGERMEGIFIIYTDGVDAEGDIFSSDTRMKTFAKHFLGKEIEIEYFLDATNLEEGSFVRGKFTVISNRGEYELPYRIQVTKPQMETSMGNIRNLFHFTNLAKTDWKGAVDFFYSEDFANIFQNSDKKYKVLYQGLSRFAGNQRNVEEFLVQIHKKEPISYELDIEAFVLEDVKNSTQRTLSIIRRGWGYTDLRIETSGAFLQIDKKWITAEDFQQDICRLELDIDATRLSPGINKGEIVISDSCNCLRVPVTISQTVRKGNRNKRKAEQKALVEIMKGYTEVRLKKLSKDVWLTKATQAVEELLEFDEDNLTAQLYRIQILIERERFQEARSYLEAIRMKALDDKTDIVKQCYYMYLTTLYNRDENFIQVVLDEIETAFANNRKEWRLAWLLMYADEEYTKNPEFKWLFLQEQFKLGCTSPILFCEAVMLLEEHPSYILRLDEFEQNVLWYAAKKGALYQGLIEQLQYLVVRISEYSPLLYRTLAEVYRITKSTQTIQAICKLLVLGNKCGPQYLEWYEKGVEKEVRVPRLYECYMMSLDLEKEYALPKMLLMYFAYQSDLDYERNAYLYAYIERHKEQYPDIEVNYRIAIERFVLEQIKQGHINQNLAYLYQQMVAPQMLRDEMAYAFTPLLFMHRIVVKNPQITSVVVLHDRVNGESIYPVINGKCQLPIYGEDYQLLLQDRENNRYCASIAFENHRLMETERFMPVLEKCVEGRLSFDLYLCEANKDYIVINQENVKRFKYLVESEQIVDSFKKEIRTNLLRFYYENDMIGELDNYLEEIEPENLDAEERAEFIQYLIYRGMFEKAYIWIRRFGMKGVHPKSVARLISRRIVDNGFTKEEFLLNVAYYIFRHTRYDENILKYLSRHYEGKSSELCDIWDAAQELGLDTCELMQRMLRQLWYTDAFMARKTEVLLCYAEHPRHDDTLVRHMLTEVAYSYLIEDVLVDEAVFDRIYELYRQTGALNSTCKLALLKCWAEHSALRREAARESVSMFIKEFLQSDICFSFFIEYIDWVPELYKYEDKVFLEYKAAPGTVVRVHYIIDGGEEEDNCYVTEDMKDLYEGMYVKNFTLFHGEVLQYYITEHSDGEVITQSGELVSPVQGLQSGAGRFAMLNDVMTACSMQDDATATQLLEEYLKKDFYTRQLFTVI
ncbi:MAG: hypothetical protein IJ326_00125 [Lachnospiraceae bacterium]|nr:hypothetical protein [Lachnospiraceae bacterium]